MDPLCVHNFQGGGGEGLGKNLCGLISQHSGNISPCVEGGENDKYTLHIHVCINHEINHGLFINPSLGQCRLTIYIYKCTLFNRGDEF